MNFIHILNYHFKRVTKNKLKEHEKEINYWHYFSRTGKKEKEGHFKNGKKINWWLFYDSEEHINHKCQLKNNKKNGYCLMYRKQKLISAVKFSEGKKIKEWTDLNAFKKENKLSDLK